MLKFMRKFWVIASIAALTVSGFTSCSDDDDTPAPEPETPSVKDDMFPYGLYKTDDIEDIVCNSDGEVTKIKTEWYDYNFEYLNSNKDPNADVRITITGGYEGQQIEARLNDDGFISAMRAFLSDRDTALVQIDYEFRYNADYQLNYVKTRYKDGYEEEYNQIYSDGDIVAVQYADNNGYESNWGYGNTDLMHPTPILNKGGVMLWGEGCYYIDENNFFDYLYLAKLLGKPTKHLPLTDMEVSFDWTFNDDYLPTSFEAPYCPTTITWLSK